MRPVSARFLDAITGSHAMAVRLRSVPAGQTGVEPVGGVLLGVRSGDVQQDGKADIRSSLDCEIEGFDPITGASLWPAAADDPLTPYGAHELFVERGVAFGGGQIEYVSLGYFRINDIDQTLAPDGPITIAGTDRMSMIIDSKLTTPRQFSAATTYRAVVEQLVFSAYLDAVIDWDDDAVADSPTGRSSYAETDRYAFLRELITGLGKVFYFDYRGVLVIRTPPPETAPVWLAGRGEGGVLLSASRSISRSGVYNGVLASGEALDDEIPVRSLAVDNDPESPTYWSGTFGRVTREFSSPLLTTTSQCALAAATLLRRATGLPYNVDVSAIPNPALEPDDPIAIGFDGKPVRIPSELIMGDSFSRVVADGAGLSESGHSWGVAAGANVNVQVDGSVMTRTLDANTIVNMLMPSSIGRRDVDVALDVMVPATATGASLVVGAALRYATASEFMSSRIEFNTNGMVTLKVARHGPPGVAYNEPGVLVDLAPYAAGQWWTVRTRTRGDRVELKAWPRDETEPGAWQLSVLGANEIEGAVNRFGIMFWRVAGNSNAGPQYTIDNYRAYSVPPRALQGGEIHVLDTLTIPLTAAGAMSGSTREQSLVSIGVLP